jgi:predicted RNase H-like nuclease (RuvC/YqgF family)
LDQTITSGDTSIELRLLEQQISSEEKTLQSAQNNLTSLDKLVDRSTDEESTKIRQRQKNERKQLADQITTSAKTIKQLNQEALPLRKQNLKLEAEVGPIKYIADLIYGSSDKELLEKAVRGVIILLVIVFDPLAIALLLAANHSLKTSIPPRRRPVVRRNGIVEIDKDSIARM